MIARSIERARLRGMLVAATDGKASWVAVVGPAGIGKSTLLDQAAEDAAVLGLGVRRVVGTPSEYAFPFAALHALLGPDLRLADLSPVLAASIGQLTPAVAPLIPAVAAALVNHLSVLAERQPMLIAVDDVQWIDPSSATVFGLLAASIVAEHLTIVFTHRTGEARPEDSELSADWRVPERDTAAPPHDDPLGWLTEGDAIELGPFSHDESIEFLIEQGVDPTETTGLAKLAGGLPLALAELSRSGAHRGRGFLGMASLYAVRLKELSALAKSVCEAVAVEGDSQALRAMFPGRLAEAVREASSAGVLAERAGDVIFAHPLVRVAALTAMSPSDIRKLHHQFAELLDSAVFVDRIALHRAAAAIGPDETAADGLVALSERARSRGALVEAAGAMLKAAALTIDGGTRTRRIIGGAQLVYFSGDPVGALTLIERASRDVSDPQLVGDADLARAQAAEWERPSSETIGILHAVAERFADSEPRRTAEALALASSLAMMFGDLAGGVADAERALELAQSQGEFLLSMLAGGNLVWNLFLQGERERADQIAGPIAGLLKMAAETESIEGVTVAMGVSMMAVIAEDWVEADALLSQSLGFARRLGVRLATALLSMVRGNLLWRLGRWDEAYLLSTQVLSRRDLPAVSYNWGRASAAQIAASMGLSDDVNTWADEVLPEAQRLENPLVSAWMLAARGHLALAEGRSLDALVDLDQVHDLTQRMGLQEPGFFLWHGDWLSALIEAGLHDDARRAIVTFRGVADRTNRRWLWGVLARADGQLGGNSERDAESPFEEAIRVFAELGMPFEVARTHLARALTGLHSGAQTTSVEADLDEADRQFAMLGAATWRTRVTAARKPFGRNTKPPSGPSNDVGATPQRNVVADVPRLRDVLTPAELRVVTSVAEGRTNRDAATELGLSDRTIEYHLRSAYRKLGVTNRSTCVALVIRARSVGLGGGSG